jgi:calcium/calmodulin-dependent protein kinase I
VSKDAKSLISSLLTVNANNRLSADTALKNGWITAGDDVLMSQDLGVNLKEFKKFNAKRKFKAAVSTVMAAQKLTSLGMEFKKNLE